MKLAIGPLESNSPDLLPPSPLAQRTHQPLDTHLWLPLFPFPAPPPQFHLPPPFPPSPSPPPRSLFPSSLPLTCRSQEHEAGNRAVGIHQVSTRPLDGLRHSVNLQPTISHGLYSESTQYNSRPSPAGVRTGKHAVTDTTLTTASACPMAQQHSEPCFPTPVPHPPPLLSPQPTHHILLPDDALVQPHFIPHLSTPFPHPPPHSPPPPAR